MSRPRPTLSDAVIVAISPALIMALVGSLVFFLAEAFGHSEHPARLNFICFLFVMASVCIGRISIEEGGGRATMFALPLAAVTVLAVWQFVAFTGPLAQFGALVGVAFVALIMWSSYKLTWDCTVVEDWQQASNEGILQSLGLDEPPSEIQQTARHGRASEESRATSAGDVERTVADPSERAGRKRRTYWWDVLLGRSKKPKVPGRWVVYFSLAAIPLYGIGQMAIPASDQAGRRYAFLLLCVYVASGLALLVTTSFLGVRRYLRQRRVEMPAAITRTWLITGGVLIVALMFAAWLLPRPGGSEYSVTDLAPFEKKPRQASPYAVGSDGEQSGGGRGSSSQSKDGSAGTSSGSGSQKGKSGDQSGSSASKTGSSGKSGDSSGQSSQGQQNSSGSGGDRSNNQSGDKQGSSGQSDKSGQSGANQSGTNDKNGSNTDSNRSQGEQGNDSRDGNQNSGGSQRTNGQRSGPPPASGSQGSGKRQQSTSGPQRSNAQGSRSNPSQNNSSSGKQRSLSTSSQSSRNSWSPSQMFSGIAPWLAVAIKWLFYLVLLAIAVYAAWRWRRELKRELSKLWAEFKKLLAKLRGLWARLWNREKPAPASAPEQTQEGRAPPRPFASFADPFASGTASSLSPEELVQYSFEALEAWGRENDCPRSPEQTPYEYSTQIARREQSLSGAARDLAEVYSITAYAGASLVPASVDRLRGFWQQLTSAATAP